MDNLIYIFVLIFGLVIGSFLNALTWRLRSGERMWDRSRCTKCHKIIPWHDNIPVFSFIALRGKCRHCRNSISWQYPSVELIVGLLFLIAWRHESGIMDYESWFSSDSIIFGSQPIIQVLRDWFLVSVMTVVFIYDLRWYLILDRVTVPAFLVLAALNLYLGMDWLNMLISVIIGSSFFLIQYIISRGKWIGGGDIRLGALMGVSLGWPGILIALFIAYILGSVVGLGLIWHGGKKWGSKVPFGTFLAVATLISFFWGQSLMAWYLDLISLH